MATEDANEQSKINRVQVSLTIYEWHLLLDILHRDAGILDGTGLEKVAKDLYQKIGTPLHGAPIQIVS